MPLILARGCTAAGAEYAQRTDGASYDCNVEVKQRAFRQRAAARRPAPNQHHKHETGRQFAHIECRRGHAAEANECRRRTPRVYGELDVVTAAALR